MKSFNKRKIGIAYGYFVSNGGIGRHIAETAKCFSNPQDYSILTLEKKFEDFNSVKIEYVQCKRDLAFLNLEENHDFSRAISQMQRNQDLILHSHGVYNIKPDIYTAHICLSSCFNLMLSVFGKDIVERCVQNFQEIVNTEKRMLDELEENQIFAVSKKMSVDLANEYGFNKNKIKIILNSSRFLVRRSREFLGEEGCNEITLGTIGGNFYGKGLPFVCQLISEINKRGYKSKCFIAGCNSQTLSDLKAFLDKEGISDIIDSLILKGKIEVDETFYSQLDCYLCLSLLENHSLSTLEAMSLGIPVMSNCANSVFHDAKLSDPSLNFCELRNLNDVQEMADSLENIFLDCDYRNNLINSGFKAVNQTSWKSVAQEYEKLYFSLS